MSPKALFSRLPVDPYIAAIVGMVGLATALPAHGSGAVVANYATDAAIALLFFLHGARLSPQAALAGAWHWRLHMVVLASTFMLFPALGLGTKALFPKLLTPSLWTGVILLCALPSTVQSSIAFTSIARGNVPAALCAATASNLLGMGLTPLLVGVLLGAQRGFSARGAGDIVLQLLVPFAAGQLARPWIGGWALRHKTLLGLVDRGSILLVVYAAFSEGVTQGIWRQLSLSDLASASRPWTLRLLAAVLLITTDRQPPIGLLPRRRGVDRLLRLEKEPRERSADGDRSVGRPAGRADRAAADALPPDPAYGVRRAGEALRQRRPARRGARF